VAAIRYRVERIDPGVLSIEGGERIAASTIVWAGGVRAPTWLADAGIAVDGGRVTVEDDLRLANHLRAFVIGDAAAVRSPSGALQPQVAQVAVQGGRHAARQIGRLIGGRPTQRFRYFDKGSMAMVGVYAAVIQSGRIRFSGRLAWVAWGLLHLMYLPGMPNRLRALQTWRWWHVTHEASGSSAWRRGSASAAGRRTTAERQGTVDARCDGPRAGLGDLALACTDGVRARRLVQLRRP